MSSQGHRVPGLGYDEYIKSNAWKQKRAKYWLSKLPKTCFVCGAARHPGMHLHHRTYKNFGNERLMDLVPICQQCHNLVHEVYESDPKWKVRGLWAATNEARKVWRKNRSRPAQKARARVP